MSNIFLTYANNSSILNIEMIRSMIREVKAVPRPRKCRRVCQMPHTREFRPVSERPCGAAVVLTVDEYEAVRWIDKQGFSQEECSAYMQVARTTVQLIYNSARKKIADALVEGRPLLIEGGDYQLCDSQNEFCGCGGCKRHRWSEEYGGWKNESSSPVG